MKELTPAEKRWEKALTIVGVLTIFLFIGLALYLLKHLIFLSLVVVLLCPVFTLLAIKNDHLSNKGFNTKSTLNTVMTLSLICGIVALSAHDVIESRLLSYIFEGRVKTVDFLNSNDDGAEFWDTKRVFIPATEAGKIGAEVMSYSYWAVVVGLFLLNFKMWGDYRKPSVKRFNRSPFVRRWNEVQEDIKKAKSYGDTKTLQKLNVHLQWLVSIKKLENEKEIKELKGIRRDFDGDYDEVNRSVCIRFTASDLNPPTVFDRYNDRHKRFAFDTLADFEIIVGRTKFENLPLVEDSLSFPKEHIRSILNFFASYANLKAMGIAPEYVDDMKTNLREFVSEGQPA